MKKIGLTRKKKRVVSRTCGSEEDGNCNQAERAEKNIPVYLEETLHFHTVEQGFLAKVFPEWTVISQPEQTGHAQSGILCHERA